MTGEERVKVMAVVVDFYRERGSLDYEYLCQKEDGEYFTFPVNYRRHHRYVEEVGTVKGQVVEYEWNSEPPKLKFRGKFRLQEPP